ncbi:hypothetical protein UA45_09250 [Morganella morganii]|uniref:Uncharacterized protein n=1 Tax=Morganella morganii TaxID=582 RepID=A0A0D8LA05_MORMO|nr:hypothetical protein UA45_09250 [Morganella morganii]
MCSGGVIDAVCGGFAADNLITVGDAGINRFTFDKLIAVTECIIFGNTAGRDILIRVIKGGVDCQAITADSLTGMFYTGGAGKGCIKGYGFLAVFTFEVLRALTVKRCTL